MTRVTKQRTNIDAVAVASQGVVLVTCHFRFKKTWGKRPKNKHPNAVQCSCALSTSRHFLIKVCTSFKKSFFEITRNCAQKIQLHLSSDFMYVKSGLGKIVKNEFASKVNQTLKSCEEYLICSINFIMLQNQFYLAEKKGWIRRKSG